MGKPLSGQGIDGLTTTYEYDVFGRTKKTHLPEGYTLTQSYGWDIGNGAIYYTLLDHPGKPNVKTWYDLLGREIKSETDAFGSGVITQNKTYDAKGNVATSTQPYKANETALTTTTTYDVYNRPTNISTSEVSFGTTTIGYAYNAGNLTVTTTNPAAQVSSKTTDATGQTISATDHGGTLTYTYNSQGNLLTVVKDGVTLTSSQYDVYGRQTQLTDQNAGTTTYAYDALGQLTSQTNANGNLTTMAYDVVGRIITRTGVEGTTTHEYFANGNGAATGQLKKITSFAGNTEEYTYDSDGRLSTTTETVDGTAHATSYSYNIYGDVTAKTFPSGFGIIQTYDANGYLTQIKNANNTPLYTNNGLSGLGVNTNYTLGNGKTSTVNHFFGMPTQYSTAGVQDLLLTWNYASGNLTQRKDNIKGREENFTYDNLNRLSSAQVVGQAALTMNYGNIGNIDFKTDAGAYTYHPTKPNAVTFVTNPQSVVPSLQQHISYTAFAQPAGLVENNYALTYTYGSDYNRLRAITQQNGSEINRRYYFGDYEKDVTAGATKHLHYISSPAGLIAIVVRESGSDTYYYTYTDHLGSILTVTYDNGTVVGEQSFDAWGRYRDVNTWVATTTAPSGGVWAWLTRGYTGHEHLRPFALINMNGRLYDPALGRVLSPDLYVQDPHFTQNFNRYTYAYNNPLAYSDPDGNTPLAAIIIGAVVGGFNGWQIGRSQGATGWEMAGYIFGGAAIGAISGGFANSIASSGMAFANTAAIIGGSTMNSIGMSMLSGGNVTTSFGVASYNWTTNEFGFLGKPNNSTLDNIGYGLGALANIQDIVAGTHGTNVEVKARKKLFGHSEHSGEYTTYDANGNPLVKNITVSVGPNEQLNDNLSALKWEMQYVKRTLQGNSVNGENVSYIQPGDPAIATRLSNVNGKWLASMTERLNRGRNLLDTGRLKYGILYGCVNFTSRSLFFAGVLNFNALLPVTAPVLLNVELAIRNYAMIYSSFIIKR